VPSNYRVAKNLGRFAVKILFWLIIVMTTNGIWFLFALRFSISRDIFTTVTGLIEICNILVPFWIFRPFRLAFLRELEEAYSNDRLAKKAKRDNLKSLLWLVILWTTAGGWVIYSIKLHLIGVLYAIIPFSIFLLNIILFFYMFRPFRIALIEAFSEVLQE